jgi:uncharacterized protein (TIGR02271 family)
MRDMNQLAQDEIVAFFKDQSQAISAISELKEAGFTADQIGFATSGNRAEGESITESNLRSDNQDHRGMWEKVKDFFSGEQENYQGADREYDNAFSHLSFSPDQSRYYSSGISAGGALVTVRADSSRLAVAREILAQNQGDLRTSGFEQVSSRSDQISRGSVAGSGDTERRLELRGELLRAVKQRVQTGEVRLRKDVVTENQTINVPVTREDVIVERVPVENAGSRAGVSGAIGEGEEIRIPVSEERVSVTKEPVVTGEVRVQKRAVQDTQQVSDTVRHEELRVENEGNVPVKNKTTTGKKKPAA